MGGVGVPWKLGGCRVRQVTHPIAEPRPRAAAGSGRGDVCLFPSHCQPLPAVVSPAKVFWGWGSLPQAGSPQPEGNLVQREHRQIPTGLAKFSSLKQTAPKTGMFCCWKLLSQSLPFINNIH